MNNNNYETSLFLPIFNQQIKGKVIIIQKPPKEKKNTGSRHLNPSGSGVISFWSFMSIFFVFHFGFPYSQSLNIPHPHQCY